MVKESRAHNFNFPGKLTAEAEESGNQFAAGETEAWRGVAFKKQNGIDERKDIT